MNFACEKCQRRYTLPDDKLRGRSVKVRCKNCQNLLTVGPLPEVRSVLSPWEDEPTRAAPGLDPALPWFAMVHGTQQGPWGPGEFVRQISSGNLTLKTYLWRPGMAEWLRAADLAEVVPLFNHSAPPVAAKLPVVVAPPTPRKTGSQPAAHTSLTDDEATVAVAARPRANPPLERKSKPAAAAPSGPMGELFSDIDITQAPVNRRAEPEPAPPADDPFAEVAALDASDLPPGNESTSFFIAQSGVKRRNSPWKIAAAAALAVLVPTGLYFGWSTLGSARRPSPTSVGVSSADDEDDVVLPGAGSAMGDLLMGKRKKTPGSPNATGPRARPDRTGVAAQGGNKPAENVQPAKAAVPSGRSSKELAALYGDANKRDVGPALHKLPPVQETDTPGGPPPAAIARVVSQTQPAFQFCIEQQLKKNPGFRGGKVSLVATVGSSGTVKKAQLSRHELDTSDLGECLKTKAKRMTFPAFAGDDVDLDIPLILTTSL